MDSYPNVWPEGGFFGFSGLDGETRYDEPLIMSGREDGVGWNFRLDPAPRLLANLGEQRLGPRNSPTDFVLPDCWYCSVRSGEQTGVVEGAFVDRSSLAIVIAFPESDGAAIPDLYPVGEATLVGNRVTFSGKGWWLVVLKSAADRTRRFGLGISYASVEEAAGRAEVAFDADVRAAIGKRLGFYTLANAPDTIVDIKRRAYFKAAAVLKLNVETPQGRFTTRWFRSDAAHHRCVRMLDSALIALGLQHIHRDLAHEVIEAVLSSQQEDGRVPLAASPNEGGLSPDFSNPPLLGWVLSQKLERQRDAKLLKRCYPRLAKYLNWFETHRKMDNGLYGWKIRTEDDPIRGARGAESAMGNSPRFDGVSSMTAVDLSSYMVREYRSMEIMALEMGLQKDAVEWHTRAREIKAKVDELLWDSEDMFYHDLDERGRFIPVKTTAGFLPMFAEIPDRDRAESLRMHLMHPHEFWTQCPVASVSEDANEHSKDMWRGAMWPPMNVLLFRALTAYKYYEEAHALAHKTINEISYRYALSGCLYEYYDQTGKDHPRALPRKGAQGAQGGAGFGVIEDCLPTAAAYIYLTHETARP